MVELIDPINPTEKKLQKPLVTAVLKIVVSGGFLRPLKTDIHSVSAHLNHCKYSD